MSWLIPIGQNSIAVVGRMQDINAVRQVKAALLSSQDLSVYSMNAPGFISGIDFSDHLNYWQHDIPAIMITVNITFYRIKQYHLPGDTADRLNYQKMAQVVNGVITLLYIEGNKNFSRWVQKKRHDIYFSSSVLRCET